MRRPVRVLLLVLPPTIAWLYVTNLLSTAANPLMWALRAVWGALVMAGATALSVALALWSRNFVTPVKAEDGVITGNAGVYAFAMAVGYAASPIPLASLPVADRLAVSVAHKGAFVSCVYFSLLKPPVERARAAARALEALGFKVIDTNVPTITAGRAMPVEYADGYGTIVVERDWRGREKASFYPVTGKGKRVYNVSLSARHFADPRTVREAVNRLLALTRPPAPKEGIEIGEYEGGGALFLPFNTHVGVFGITGAGKSSLLALIARDLPEDVLVIDFWGEYTGLYGFEVVKPIDPVAELSPEEAAEILDNSAELVWGEDGKFTPIVYNVVVTALGRLWERSGMASVAMLASELEEWRRREQRLDVQSAIDAALRRISLLRRPDYAYRIPGGRAVLDLSGLSDYAKVAAANAVIYRLLKERRPRRLTIIIDEVHRLAPLKGYSRPLENLLREGRALNIRVVMADQTLTAVNSAAVSQCGMLVLFQHNPADLPILQRMLGNLASVVTSLQPREVLVWHAGGWRRGTIHEAPRLAPKGVATMQARIEEAARAVAQRYRVRAEDVLALYDLKVRPEALEEPLRSAYREFLARIGELGEQGEA